MLNLERLSNIISIIHDASLEQEKWDSLANELSNTFDADSCCFQIRDVVTGMAYVVGKTSNLDASLVEDYETWYHKDDLLIKRALQAGVNKAFIGSELIDDQELVATDFFQSFCAPQSIFHTLGGAQDIGDNCIGVIKIYRPKEGKSFVAADKQNLALILPHLKRAMRLSHQLWSMSQGQTITYSAIDQLSLGVIIVGVGGVVRFANKTIERMLEADFGMAIRHGRLLIDDAKAQQATQKALENVQKSSAGIMVPWRDKMDRPVSLLVTPLVRGTKAVRMAGPVAAIFINNPEERRKPSEAVIGALYGLTPAEAKLTKALLEGRHLQDYAGRSGISLHTAKTQLKQIFQKTGHGRQSDLLRDIMANPVLRMRL